MKSIQMPAVVEPVRFIIWGMAPRTKKNSPRILTNPATGKQFIAQSEAHNAWADKAIITPRPGLLPDMPWNCAALIYREANTGDANNFYAAISDLLQKAGVVSNDKWIVTWEGSRLRKDAKRPRIEVTLTPAPEDPNDPSTWVG